VEHNLKEFVRLSIKRLATAKLEEASRGGNPA